MTRIPRKPSDLSASIHLRLNSYALAASAAGVSVLALTQASQAKVIYTPVNKDCSRGCILDLENDKHTDLKLAWNDAGGGYTFWMSAYVPGRRLGTGGIVGTQHYDASALQAGFRIKSVNLRFASMAGGVCSSTFCKIFKPTGLWANDGKGVTNRYLGLKVHTNHYGWARFNVRFPSGERPTFTLTGYAYETIPNEPIIAGKTKGKDVLTVHPGSLGALAAGAARLQR